jgi:hypothetical protein
MLLLLAPPSDQVSVAPQGERGGRARQGRIVTVKLELKPEIEAALMAKARARGLSLEAYVDQVLQEATSSKRPAARKSLAQLFAESPLKGLSLNFERDPDKGRPFGGKSKACSGEIDAATPLHLSPLAGRGRSKRTFALVPGEGDSPRV